MQAIMTYSRARAAMSGLRDPLTTWLQTSACQKPQTRRDRQTTPGTVAVFIEMLWSDSAQQRSRAARQLSRLGAIAIAALSDLQELILLESDEDVLRDMLIALESIARAERGGQKQSQYGTAKNLLQAILRAFSMPAA